ncbi:cysteine desulfurase [Tenacibaculum sp. MAR_2009_124]|uniref:cysteine desulfurase family protein n=1 Tax=Tenacibaculum sp. MAR_2009_124 TaxID=1250059 RepID=UPI00089D7B74|nr:cysteine desulfurase family protein [Tenacibaculum sp. MAR_2009_124]SEC90454.1 cysteine desulfurase [Tenacibaculum sp. MAR_2009_124]
MNTIYLDNAATTPVLPEVIEVINRSMFENFGNPSSTHQFGRSAKASIEKARKNIASYFNVTSSEIVFTSGGTEADNLILQNAVINLGVDTIVTSKIEHHAVLHTVDFLREAYNIEVVYLNIDAKGNISTKELSNILSEVRGKALVSLMWVNNEIGNLLPIQEVANICKQNNALFHSDTVQAIGHFNLDLQEVSLDFMTASAHKFHGPKGVGFAYVKKGCVVKPLFHGGDQERGVRSSTENVHSILGMEKAMELSYSNMNEDRELIEGIKVHFIERLKGEFTEVKFNGESENLNTSSYTILNVRLPWVNEMMLFSLDMKGIAASGGSACQSGSNKGSHVLNEFLLAEEKEKTSVRFSFSKLNTIKEIETTINVLKEFYV